jgi:hypothetical protein
MNRKPKRSETMKKVNHLMLSLSVCLLLTAAAQAFTIIDDFDSSNEVDGWRVELGSDVGNPADQVDSETKYETALPGVLGGTRSLTTITNPWTYNYSGTDYTVNGGVSGSLWLGEYDGREGFYSMSTGASGGRGEFNIVYDAGGNGLNGDFSNGTKISLDVDPDHFGFGTTTVIDLTLSDGVNEATATKMWSTYTLPPDGFYSMDFLFSDLLTDNPSLNLANIQSIELNYLADLSHDVSLDRITTDATNVPEPATLGLLSLGGLAMLKRRRK